MNGTDDDFTKPKEKVANHALAIGEECQGFSHALVAKDRVIVVPSNEVVLTSILDDLQKPVLRGRPRRS